MASHSAPSASRGPLPLPTTLHSGAGTASGRGGGGGGGLVDRVASLAGSLRRPAASRGAGAGSSDSEQENHPPALPRSPSRWWKIHPFRGMVNDLRRRAPYYWSDWVDAWDYRVVPATVYMYFANILPALAFSLDMFTKTHMQYGVNEVLLASVLGAVVFSFIACQPLVIVGVTGPITVFNYTVYDIMNPTGTNYLAFMCWIGLWSLVFHWVLAVTNACNWLRYVTRFPCDIFGFYVAFIYLQKGIQVLTRLGSDEPFYLSIMIALLVFMVAYVCGELGKSTLFHHHVRVFLKDYGTPLTVVFFSGFVHIGKMRDVHLENLPTSKAFFPTSDRGWLVHFWDISVGDVFLAVPFAILLTILFYFDHNVSSLIAQGTEFPLKKPAGFHWDLFLLGLTTGVAGLLGLPFPNGLIPQAPFHTESLCVARLVADDDEDGPSKGHVRARATHVVEQRVSNLAQGLLTLGTMSGPLLVVVHLIPQGVLAGLFFVMGVQALEANGITDKLLFLARDVSFTPGGHPLKQLPRRAAIWAFVALELLGFGATFAITQTVAAVGFPVVILLLIPARAALLPRWFAPRELAVLDAPTASPFTMESVGGTYVGAGGDLALDGAGGGASSEDDAGGWKASSGRGGLLRGGLADGGDTAPSSEHVAAGGRRSEEELAELGEGRNVRRRNSAVGGRERGGGETIEMARIGVSRRQGGKSVDS